MSFNDYKILTDKDYSILKTNYEKVYSSEVSDLQEIIDKMQEQKSSLIINNQNGKYNQVIEKITSNISELQSLIKSSATNNSNYRQYHQAPSVASMLNSYKNLMRAQQLDDPNGAIHPVRSIDEMTRHNDLNSGLTPEINMPSTPQTPPTPNPTMPMPNIPTSPNSPSEETQPISPIREGNNSSRPNTPNRNIYQGESGNDIPSQNIGFSPNQTPNNNLIDNDNPRQPSPANSRTNINKRNHPMQMGFITNFIKSLKIGFNSHKARKKALNSEINYTLAMHRNKFHNIQIVHTACNPHNKIVTNQIDIIRLLLLYLALRPTCRYCSRIASITNEQFDLLLSLGVTAQSL